MNLPASPILPNDPVTTDWLRRLRVLLSGRLDTNNFTTTINNNLINSGEYTLIIPAAGNNVYADYTFYDGNYSQVNISIRKATIFAGTMPTGGNGITIDFLKDGVEQSKILTLATTASNHLQTTIFSTALTYTPTERQGMRVKTVGSTEAGRNLLVILYIKVI